MPFICDGTPSKRNKAADIFSDLILFNKSGHILRTSSIVILSEVLPKLTLLIKGLSSAAMTILLSAKRFCSVAMLVFWLGKFSSVSVITLAIGIGSALYFMSFAPKAKTEI